MPKRPIRCRCDHLGEGAPRCISEIAEVASSVAAPIRRVAFGGGATNDVPACGEAGSTYLAAVPKSESTATAVSRRPTVQVCHSSVHLAC
jgi:hypothetical protein